MKETLDLRGLNFEEGYIAVIDKPLNWTSTDVVRKIKFALRKLGYRKIKVGHAGTLDPLASGILLVCIGRATKMVDALQAEEKEYVADVMLGATTPSYDLEHPVDATFPTQHITRGKVLEALAALSGERLQSPPVYSAKKIDGMRAYELARAGEEVEMRKALVHIYEIYAASDLFIGSEQQTYIAVGQAAVFDGLNGRQYLRYAGFVIGTEKSSAVG